MARVVIYKPKGRALEYAPYACEVYDACDHKCTYCFNVTSGKRSAADFYRPAKPVPNLIRDLQRVVGNYRAVEGQPLKRVLLSFGCDPYQPVNDQHGLAREVIQLFNDADVPYTILSKGGLRVSNDLGLIRAGGGSYAATIVLTNEDDRMVVEPGAASVSERVETLKRAHEIGIRTWVSIEPPIVTEREVEEAKKARRPILPLQALDVIDLVAPYVSAFKIGKWNHETLADQIDWKVFAYEVYGRLKRYPDKYYLIKHDLAPFCGKNVILNTIPEGF